MDRTQSKNQISKIVSPIDEKISPFFTDKLPALPDNIREILVKIIPYLTILGVVLSSFALLALLGFIAVTSPFVVMYGSTGSSQAVSGGIIGLILLGLQTFLQLLAIPGLFKRQMYAWNFLFASTLISLIFNLISFDIFNLVINFLVSFYLLYQTKPYFKN